MSEAIENEAPGASVDGRMRRRSLPLGGWPWLAVLTACGPTSASEQSLGLSESASSLINHPESEAAAAQAGPYTLFEADPVRPIAVLERSGLVAVTNTVDNYLELLAPTRRTVEACGAVSVGLQPVAVAVIDEGRDRAELWVVNQLSDSVSVVALDTRNCKAEVIRTLAVGDEPRDIVVASDSQGNQRVFVATAHRGQQHPSAGARLATDLVTPPSEKLERGLADVLVFDPRAPDAPPAVVNLFADRPRALAVADGVVYAASFFSGNRTTVIPAQTVTARGLASLQGVLALDADGAPIEQGGELALAPGAQGRVIEGGLPAVAGSGRCLADPRDQGDDFQLLKLCAETDAQQHLQRVLVQQPGAANPSCQCTSGDGSWQPTTGLIVKFFDDRASCGESWTTFPDGTQGCWLDAAPNAPASPARFADQRAAPLAWNQQVKFSLPDQDVFGIGVDDLQVSSSFSGVGTILFSLSVQPQTGKLFVTNTDAQNLTRFEGHGSSSSSSVIGHLHESRITVIDPGNADAGARVQPIHLNSHIDYARCCDKDPEENSKSFAFPTSGVFSADGERFFFSALGSDKIGIVSAGALRSGFDQDAARAAGDLRELFLSDDVANPEGPVALALDARRDRLYVKTQFDNALLVVDAERERLTGRVRLPSPEPESVTRGRSVLYNARLTSSHGDSACASCHVFGDFDGLAWDLGDPEGHTVTNPGPFALPGRDIADFRSNKGPMTTQTLRGLANQGPLHWRGDRTRRFQDAPGEQPDFGSLNEASSFGEFDAAIGTLNGNDRELDPAVFAAFTEFSLQLSLPPNPNRHLDNTLTPDQAAARALFFGCSSMSDAQFAARTCLGNDGSLVSIDAASTDCLCARNPIVDGLRRLPQVQAFAELLAARLAEGGLRARLEALASDSAQLPPDQRAAVASAAAEFAAGNAQLLGADLTPAEDSLLSASLAAALSQLSSGLSRVLAASTQNGTSTAQEIADALFAALPSEAVPPDVPRDAQGVSVIFDVIAEVTGLSELARNDELARGTSAFRNLLSGCEVGVEAPACKLRVTDTMLTCDGCHRLDPKGNAEFGVSRPGFFGTDGRYSFEGESQVFKVPHLRNLYQKAGRFGNAPDGFFLPESVLGARRGGFFSEDTEFTGPQVRGFGFFHDGGADTLHRFHGATVFARSSDNRDALDAFRPRAEQTAACVALFRQAPSSLFAAASEQVRRFLPLCTAPGPLPDVCFSDASAPECQAALAAAGAELGLDVLPQIFAENIEPLCFQLGSMAEGGSPDGVCYPAGLHERAQLESFMLAFDTNLKPMVGQQLTLASAHGEDARLAPLLAAAAAGDCDLALSQHGRGYLITQPDSAQPEQSRLEDRRGQQLRLGELLERGGAATLTCHPPAVNLGEARRAAFGRAR
jgi:hypothetical protein